MHKERDHNDVLRSQLLKGSSRKELAAAYYTFGPRLKSALEIFHQKQVVKYILKPSGRVQWLVEGKESDYLIYEKAPYCSCLDFYVAIINGTAEACKHLLAQKLASITGWHQTTVKPDSFLDRFMTSWHKEKESTPKHLHIYVNNEVQENISTRVLTPTHATGSAPLISRGVKK